MNAKIIELTKSHIQIFNFFFLSLAYGGYQVRGGIRASFFAGLCHGHGNTGFKPHLWPTPQIAATSDTYSTE